MNDPESWDIAYPSKFRVFKGFPEITTLFLPLSRQVAITDPFLALVDALDLDAPQGDQGWLKGEPPSRTFSPVPRASGCHDSAGSWSMSSVWIPRART